MTVPSARDLAVVAGLDSARYPSWVDADQFAAAANGVPPTLSAGFDVADAQAALIAVELNEDPALPSAWVTVDTVADATTYTVTVGGTPSTYVSDADATLVEILVGLRDAINTDAVGVAVTVDLDGDGEADAVRVFMSSGAAPVVSITAGDMTATDEATAVSVRVWGLPTGRDRWSLLHIAPFDLAANYVDVWRVAPLRRVYVELTATDGRVRIGAAPTVPTAADLA